MKKIYAIIALLLLSTAAFAQEGRKLYDKYSDLPQMEAIYISPAMFRLIGRIPDIEMQSGDVNLSPLIKSMTGFYVLSTENPETAARLSEDMKAYVRSGRYELLMESKDSGEVVRMYTVGDEKTITSFVLLNTDKEEASFICFEGKMDRAAVENLIAGQ